MRPRQHWIFDNRAYSCSKEGKTWKKQKKKKKTGTRICRVSRGCKRFTRNYIFKMPVRTDFWSGADRGMVFQQSPRYANRGECAVIFAYAERYDQGSTLAWAYCLSGIDIRVSSSDFPIENAHRKIPQYFKICGSTNWFLPHWLHPPENRVCEKYIHKLRALFFENWITMFLSNYFFLC